ncbi:UNVERIFIED_CONTAM: branched-chain amino acid transport system substrate-binding protein [Brevibacillus sp. OAP136]
MNYQKVKSWITKSFTCLLVLLLISGCASKAGSDSETPVNAAAGSDRSEIVIGASIPETGELASFGVYAKWGYEKAIAEVNKEGGIMLSSINKKLPVKLVLYDDSTRPENVTRNVQRLILNDKVDALLSPATTPMVLAGAIVAEREKVPMVAALATVRSFLDAKPDGWNYVWLSFFDEVEMTDKHFLTMDKVQTNKKIALFTDNGPDGIGMAKLWREKASKFGYEIVSDSSFPVGTTGFGDMIRKAKDANAEIVISSMMTPDAISLVKQMKTLNYKPKGLFIEKGAEPSQFEKALGADANGIKVAGYWDPTLPFPGAQELRQSFEEDTGETYSQHIADTYTIAKILLDAIEAAGSLDKTAINNEIGKTDKTYVLGPINYTKGPGKNVAPLPTFMLQWQNSKTEIVYPENLKTKDIIEYGK